MNPSGPSMDIHECFLSFDWVGVIRAVDEGQRLSSALPSRHDWSKLFPDGISAEQADVLRRAHYHDIAYGNGRNLLHAMCEKGDAASVRVLLDAGLDPCAVGDFNFCPLVYALYGEGFDRAHVETAELLLERGANPNAEGLGSTGRASFVFLETLPGVLSKDGWEGVDRLWRAISPRVDWSLRYEGLSDDQSPLINFFLMDVASRYPTPSDGTKQLLRDAMGRLQVAGVSFDPKVRDKGYGTLGKYAAEQGATAQWLMRVRAADIAHAKLNAKLKDTATSVMTKKSNPRL